MYVCYQRSQGLNWARVDTSEGYIWWDWVKSNYRAHYTRIAIDWAVPWLPCHCRKWFSSWTSHNLAHASWHDENSAEIMRRDYAAFGSFLQGQSTLEDVCPWSDSCRNGYNAKEKRYYYQRSWGWARRSWWHGFDGWLLTIKTSLLHCQINLPIASPFLSLLLASNSDTLYLML